MRRILGFVALLAIVASFTSVAKAQNEPTPLVQLQETLRNVGAHAPVRLAVEVKDLSTGFISGYNMNAVMPAASTIKIPIMVEVFRQMEAGKFGFNRRVELLAGDRDWGSGNIAESPVGATFPVSTLLEQMITVSDNTAANMLIRLVGRHNINATMRELGLHHTHLADYIRTAEWSVRTSLRTTPSDMVSLLSDMAKNKLIDEWSSKKMIGILEGQEINTLLPEPLPDIPIAHKTGSFNDTLNDVGIVYADAPYVIAVMTTDLPSLPMGRNIIRHISKVAYTNFQRYAKWRLANGLDTAPLANAIQATPQPEQTTDPVTDGGDVPMWGTQNPPAPTPTPVASATP
jgi:beta-lactamase class A